MFYFNLRKTIVNSYSPLSLWETDSSAQVCICMCSVRLIISIGWSLLFALLIVLCSFAILVFYPGVDVTAVSEVF